MGQKRSLQPATAGAAVRLRQLNERITACQACPRLIDHCTRTAEVKRASFRHETYWGRPVPNLLPADGRGQAPGAARLLIAGLAPAAHGANRTGRMFTGDRSGDFLFAALHRAGFATQPTSLRMGDGLELIDAVMGAACHCAPPDNKPTPDELAACRPFLTDLMDALPRLRVVLTLGKIGHDAVLGEYLRRGWVRRRNEARFAHGAVYRLAGAPALVCTYHPSQQNTFTGRLTPAMMDAVLAKVRALLDPAA